MEKLSIARYSLKDEEYPFDGFTHTRVISRGFIFDGEGRVCLHRLYRDDIFCKQEYYETPGGGVDEGESLIEALRRECLEETGYELSDIREIAIVEDAYNLIKRKNENHYFLAKATKHHDPHFASEGDLFIKETRFYTLEEALRLYEGMDDRLVSGLVKRRELPIIRRLVEQNLF
ncbi:MAG: NUDIX hydrolase [Bacillota bacterium]|nr:NUDIX hydrolase [Bacillota bacterium]